MKATSSRTIRNPQKLSSYWTSEWLVVALVAIFGLLFNCGLPYVSVLQGSLIDSLVDGEGAFFVAKKAGLFLTVILLVQFCRYMKRYFVRLFANRTSASMRQILYHNLLFRPISFLIDKNAGDLCVRAVSDVDLCSEGMRKITTEVFDSGVLMTAYFVTLFSYDGRLTLLSCLMIVPSILLAEKLKTVILKRQKAARAEAGRAGSLIFLDISQNVVEQIHGLEDLRREEYYACLDSLEKKNIRSNVLESSMPPIYNAIVMLGSAFILYFGGCHVIDGSFTIGQFSTYLTLFIALSAKAGKVAKLFNSYQRAKVSWNRIKPYLQSIETPADIEHVLLPDASLTVKDLTFVYPNAEIPALSDIALTAKKGELIGITGPVACGKSTLLAALTGLYPYLGKVELNGSELSTLTATERSQSIAYLLHNPMLLSDTIFNNITLGDDRDPQILTERVNRVLSDVCFDTDLSTMPEGLSTLVGSRGVRLSGGQQARIALARALYHRCPLILLDDPFSAVDMDTEHRIIANLRAGYPDSIILLVSHRLSIFPLTDHVLFLENACTFHYSEHSTLLETNAAYHTLFALQQSEEGAAHE